jgi:hypothetical protein
MVSYLAAEALTDKLLLRKLKFFQDKNKNSFKFIQFFFFAELLKSFYNA